MTQNKRELNVRELGQVAGGNPYDKNDRKEYFYNSANEKIGSRDNARSPICYVPCDKCGRPMHSGWFAWYCDPCSRRLVFVNYYHWNGTLEEFLAAAG